MQAALLLLVASATFMQQERPLLEQPRPADLAQAAWQCDDARAVCAMVPHLYTDDRDSVRAMEDACDGKRRACDDFEAAHPGALSVWVTGEGAEMREALAGMDPKWLPEGFIRKMTEWQGSPAELRALVAQRVQEAQPRICADTPLACELVGLNVTRALKGCEDTSLTFIPALDLRGASIKTVGIAEGANVGHVEGLEVAGVKMTVYPSNKKPHKAAQYEKRPKDKGHQQRYR